MSCLRVLLVTAACVLVTADVFAQTFMESQVVFKNSGVEPKLDGQLIIKGNRVDLFGWFFASDDWAEGLVGVAKNIRPWLWVSVGAGLETDAHPWRLNPNVWIGNARASSFLSVEHGGSGFWYRSMSFLKLGSRIEAGIHSQRFYGTGPAVQISLGEGYKVWASVAPGGDTNIGLMKFF